MTDRDPPPSQFSDVLFNQLLEVNQARDVGIVAFERRMQATEQQLSSVMTGKNAGFFTETLDMAERELNDEWAFQEATAVVSGRVYLVDSDLLQLVPESWGEPTEDERGRTSYFLDDMPLKSHGISAEPYFEMEDGVTLDVKVAYVFAATDDEFDRPIFTAYPGELSKHEYSSPTAEEAESRLKNHWPEQYRLLARLVSPDFKDNVSLRLKSIVRRMQADLVNNEPLRELVDAYINSKACFDETQPYLINIDKKLSIFQGDDLFAQDAAQSWVHVKIDEQMTVSGYDPRVHLSEHPDGSIHAHILVATYNAEDGDDAEYISVASENIIGFFGTRARQSIAERAFMGSELKAEFVASALTPDAAKALKASEEVTSEIIHEEKKESRYENGKPLDIIKMERLLEELEEIKKYVRQAQKQIFTTPEEARDETKKMIENYIRPRLAAFEMKAGQVFEFSGPGVMRPRHAGDIINLKAEHPHLLILGVDAKNPWMSLQDGDTLTAPTKGLHAASKEHRDEDGGIVGYSVYPAIIADISRKSFSLMNWNDAAMVSAVVEEEGVVPLDGSARINIKRLDTYRALNESFVRLQKTYGRAPIVKQMQIVRKALETEYEGGYSPLLNARPLRSVGRHLDAMKQEGVERRAAYDTIEALFIDRKIGVIGDILTKTERGLERTTILAENEHLLGQVIDINDDITEGTTSFVLRSEDGNLRYVPVSSIEKLAF